MPITVPAETAIEREAVLNPPEDSQADSDTNTESNDELSVQRSEASGLVLIPGFRFDGSDGHGSVPPWNLPEGEIFNWLTTAELTIDASQVTAVDSGRLMATSIRDDGEIQELLVKYVALGNAVALASWGTEFVLNGVNDLAAREVAAYELVKAMGGEDLGLPICIRDLDPVTHLNDQTRLTIAKKLKISPFNVDRTAGMTTTIQWIPAEMDNFAERWASLGSTNQDRWTAASDQLRYSIYRAYFYDFVLGSPCRSAMSFEYDANTDKLLLVDMGLTFPHSGFSAEKYAQMRMNGWGRSIGGAARFVDNSPPTAYDFHNIFNNLDPKYTEEAVAVAYQITDRMNDYLVERAGLTLLENDVPIECVASALLRLAYLAFAPGSVLKRPIEYVRNVCLPIRNNMAAGDPKIEAMVTYVNDMMTIIAGHHYDVVDVLSQPLPDLAELLV